jgi:hypothetical protein
MTDSGGEVAASQVEELPSFIPHKKKSKKSLPKPDSRLQLHTPPIFSVSKRAIDDLDCTRLKLSATVSTFQNGC